MGYDGKRRKVRAGNELTVTGGPTCRQEELCMQHKLTCVLSASLVMHRSFRSRMEKARTAR